MSNLLTVQDPDESAVQHASETRRLLQVWADKHLPDVETAAIPALTDERIRELRTTGAATLTLAQSELLAAGLKPATQFGELLAGLCRALQHVQGEFSRDEFPREFSYVLEGLAKDFQKRFFKAGMKWNLHAEWLAVAAIQCPYSTSGYQDRVVQAMLRPDLNGSRWYSPRAVCGTQENMYQPKYQRDNSCERFAEIAEWLGEHSQLRSTINWRTDREYWIRNLTGFDYTGIQVHYMEEDGPWIAGFLTLDDACKLRFRRVRLGAYLAEQGESDGWVREYVEKAKQQVAGASFTAYPNDVNWEDAYTTGPGSCMADSASEYNTWDEIHPVSVYSSSLYGSGDNSLVLLTSRDEDDCITGRGILNLQTNSIVRWYGDNQAERVLKRAGVNTYDRQALDGTWLALVKADGRFIHPYVDGDLGYGVIEDDRVYIRNDGICIQETGGSSYIGGGYYYCEDTGLELSEDACEYQEVTETYISHDCDSWRCPIIGEWVSGYNRTAVTLHGVRTEVSEYAYYRINQYCTLMNGARDRFAGEYSIDDEDMRQRFLDENGIDDPYEEDEDDESDEEAA